MIAEMQVYETQYRTAMERVRAASSMYGADASIYGYDLEKAAKEAGIIIEQQKIHQKNLEATRDMLLEQAKANMQASINISEMKQRAAQGGAEVSTSKLRALMGSINAVIQQASTGIATHQESTE
jgi:hypothetical protein